MVTHTSITIPTSKRIVLVDITAQVQDALEKIFFSEGICCVSSTHTTAGITINENADPDVAADIERTFSAIVPAHAGYSHSEGNSDSHIKTSLTGLSVTVPVQGGKLVLGTWQSIYFCEYDGPRTRRAHVTVIGE